MLHWSDGFLVAKCFPRAGDGKRLEVFGKALHLFGIGEGWGRRMHKKGIH